MGPMRIEPLSIRAGIAFLIVLLSSCSSLSGAEWRVEPIYGGEVRSLAFAPGDPDLVLAGTSGGQVYRSRDAGESWAPAGRAFPFPGWIVASFHFDRNDSGILWAGLRGVWGGGAVVKSDDLGATWETVAQRSDGVFVLRSVPGEPGALVLGTDTGVWIRRDEDEDWEHSSRGVSGLVEVSSLLVDPEDPRRIVAGTFRRAYRSDDGGSTWRGVFDGMSLDTQLFSLQPVPGDTDTYWASTCGWVYRSDDGGLSWQRFRNGLAQRRAPSFQVLPEGRLLTGTVAGVYHSDDDGRTWRLTTRNDLSVLSLAHHPRRPEVVLAGTEGSGVWRSVDGGTTFRPANRGLTAPRVGALGAGPSTLRAAVVHGGPADGIYRFRGRGFVHEMSRLPTVLDLHQSRDRAWAGTEDGLWRLENGIWTRVEALGSERIEQILPDPENEGLLLRTGDAVWRGRGERWQPISPEIDRPLSLDLHEGMLWWTTPEGLFRVAAGGRMGSVAAPTRGGKVVLVGGDLLLAHRDGVWVRSGSESRWTIADDGPGGVLRTGDSRWPLVLAGRDRAVLVAADGSQRGLELPFSPRELLSAAVFDGRLYLGTAGTGLLSRPLEELPTESFPAPTSVASGAVAAPD